MKGDVWVDPHSVEWEEQQRDEKYVELVCQSHRGMKILVEKEYFNENFKRKTRLVAVYLNVYQDPIGTPAGYSVHQSRSVADAFGLPMHRVACVKMQYTEGQFDE